VKTKIPPPLASGGFEKKFGFETLTSFSTAPANRADGPTDDHQARAWVLSFGGGKKKVHENGETCIGIPCRRQWQEWQWG
jgi:hypothetical protein